MQVQDLHDLIVLLERHPEWRAELRRMLLTEELLAMPETVQRLVERATFHAQRLGNGGTGKEGPQNRTED